MLTREQSFLLCAPHKASRGEDAMLYKVIFFKEQTQIGSRAWATKTEAITHAKEPLFESEATSVIIVNDDTNEIVFSGQVKEVKRPPDLQATRSATAF
jgi:hypothetical protein